MAQTTAIAVSPIPVVHTQTTDTLSCSKSDEVKPRKGSLYLNDIWRLAREKWEAAGRPNGDSSRFWLEAERELLHAADAQLSASWIQPTN